MYGLSSLFTPTLTAPRTRGGTDMAHWRPRPGRSGGDLLDRDLYVEGDPECNIRVDQHSVHAKTDDDEVDPAYFFVDDALLRSRPDCGAYLVWV